MLPELRSGCTTRSLPLLLAANFPARKVAHLCGLVDSSGRNPWPRSMPLSAAHISGPKNVIACNPGRRQSGSSACGASLAEAHVDDGIRAAGVVHVANAHLFEALTQIERMPLLVLRVHINQHLRTRSGSCQGHTARLCGGKIISEQSKPWWPRLCTASPQAPDAAPQKLLSDTSGGITYPRSHICHLTHCPNCQRKPFPFGAEIPCPM